MFVYGPPYKKNTSDFWTSLARHGTSLTNPWLCVGDFNAITSPDDKFNGRPYNNFSTNPFTDFINQFELIDLGFFGNSYTWSNHKQCLGLIKERLDRNVACSQWFHAFPSFSVNHLPAHASDHNPLLLNIYLSSLSLPSSSFPA